MAIIADDRLFPVNTYGEDFFTAVCADGRQVIIGLLCPHVIAYLFDSQGRLLGDEHRPWNHPAPRTKETGPYQIYDKPFQAALAAQIRDWQLELGYSAAPIRIRAFYDRQHSIGIELLPDHFQLPDEELEEMDEQERQEIVREREKWLASGQFVWWWAKDYWTSADGEVLST